MKKHMQTIINICLAISITAFIIQHNKHNDSIFNLKKELDIINKQVIETSYRQYVEDFIANDFDSIASHFHPPVDFQAYGLMAETKEDVINQYKGMKSTIQEGYAYSVIDDIKVIRTKNNNYLLCSDYTRYNINNEILFEGRTHYIYVFTGKGWKMNSLERKERIKDQSCM